jgi:hypothetical protein
LSFPKLPVDTQCCVLSYLACDDLAHFSVVSHAYHDVATLDHLWKPLLAEHFKAVTPLSPALWESAPAAPQFRALVLDPCLWGSTPAHQFYALAVSLSFECEAPVLQRGTLYRHSYAELHSSPCESFQALCCAACHCRRQTKIHRRLQTLRFSRCHREKMSLKLSNLQKSIWSTVIMKCSRKP